MSVCYIRIDDTKGEASKILEVLQERYPDTPITVLEKYAEVAKVDDGTPPSFLHLVDEVSKDDELLASVIRQRIRTVDSLIRDVRRKFVGNLRERDAHLDTLYHDTLDQLERIKIKLTGKQTFANLIEVFNEQLEFAQVISKKPNPSPTELIKANSMLATWDFAISEKLIPNERLTDETDALVRFLRDAHDKTRATAVIISRIMAEQVRDAKNKGLPGEAHYTLAQIEQNEDMGWLSRWMGDISRSKNPVSQLIARYLFNAKRNQSRVISNIEKRIDKIFAGINPENLLQRYKNGKLTGMLLSPFSAEYYERVEAVTSQFAATNVELKSSKLEGDALNAAYAAANKEYHDRMNEIEIAIDPRFFVVEDFKTDEFPTREAYEAMLLKEIGKEGLEFAINRSKELYGRYVNAKAAYNEYIQTQIDAGVATLLEGESTEAYQVRKLGDWDRRNSPIQYIRERYTKEDRQNFWSRRGRDYTYTLPKLSAEGMYDERYKALDSKTREALDLTVQLMLDIRARLPIDKFENTKDNFLPHVEKGIVTKILESGLGSSGLIGEAVLRSITVEGIELGQEIDLDYQGKDPITGRPKPKPPIYYVSEIEDTSKRSFDLPVILKMFAAMAVNYDYMSQVEDKVLMAFQVLQNQKEVNKGRVFASGLVNEVAAVQYAINASLYNLRKVDPKGYGELFSLNPFHFLRHGSTKTKRRQARLYRNLYTRTVAVESLPEEEQADALIAIYNTLLPELDKETADTLKTMLDAFKAGDPTFGELARRAITKRLEQFYSDLGSRRFAPGKVIDKLLRFTQLKGMGYSIPASITNIGFGQISLFTHAASNKDFNEVHLRRAMGIMAHSFGGESKANKMISKFDILFEVIESMYGDESPEFLRMKKIKDITPYGLQRRGEWFNQGTSLVAMMLKQQVEVKKEDGGTESISLWDLFDENGELAREPIGDWSTELDADEENDFTRFRNKALQLNKKLHGNYDPTSPVEAKAHVLGRALLMFRSWMYEGWQWRYEGDRYDEFLGREVRGRWRTYWTVSREQGLAGGIASSVAAIATSDRFLFMGPMARIVDTITASWKDPSAPPIDEKDVENIRANFRELQIWASLMILIIILKAGLDDDEDDENPWADPAARLAIHSLSRVQRDITFYIHPKSTMDVLRDPIPALRTVIDFEQAIRNTYRYVMEDEFRGDPPHIQWARTLPVASQVTKLMHLAGEDPK